MKLLVSKRGLKGFIVNLGDATTGHITGFLADCPEPGCAGTVTINFRAATGFHTHPPCAWALRSDPLDVIKRCREEYTDAADPNAH